MIIECPVCGNHVDKPASAVNKAKRIGAPIYCGRSCSGVGRRKNKTAIQRKEEKRLYDRDYRKMNKAQLTIAKALWHREHYDPVKAAKARQVSMSRHLAYCRTPEYKHWKREYDRLYRASKYGEFAEAYMALIDLVRRLAEKGSWYERQIDASRVTKAGRRKRQWRATAYGGES